MGVCESTDQQLDDGTHDFDEEERIYMSFWRAVREGRYEEVANILRANRDLDVDRKDARDRHRKCALHLACENGNSRMIKLLVTARADVNVSTKCFEDFPCKRGEWTPLMLAARGGHLEAMKLLLTESMPVPDMTMADASHQTVVHHAAMVYKNSTQFEAILSLIQSQCREVDIAAADIYGRTALHVAAEFGNENAVQCLVARGLDKDCKDHKGKTAYDIAAAGAQETYSTRVNSDVANPHALKPAYESIETFLLATAI